MSFTCPVCESKEFQSQIICTDFIVSKELFNIVSCKSCNLYITYPHPDENEISKYYQSEEYIPHSDKKNSFFDKLYHLVRKYTLKQKVNLVKKYVPHGTILDIGCGTGYFLEECKKNKFDAVGIEPNETARNLCNKKNLTVFQNIGEIINKKIEFDVISLWHVLEHIHQPRDLLGKIHYLLKDKGILILALPNRNSFDAKYYKNYWAGYDVPRHIYHFSVKNVIDITRNKFHLLDIYPMYFDSFYVSILSEKYKENRYAFIKGLCIGLYSNIKAIKNNEYSSLIYVLQKI